MIYYATPQKCPFPGDFSSQPAVSEFWDLRGADNIIQSSRLYTTVSIIRRLSFSRSNITLFPFCTSSKIIGFSLVSKCDNNRLQTQGHFQSENMMD
ncbi:hypothetical protein PoB_007037700 [Plakobranchus ocellatus]|uniref:Uncharacterized protein n=1 Tax=Plakobranchus ocellatus TaxID=259542 RepID=A0AAV4DHX8_9GAST|nr:hypothetical protein PoB_007037700 [Plakobranchus ocellatus]